MTQILKDSETAAPSAGPSQGSTGNVPAGAPSRPQPVALEVPVTVNGARTVDGSDKREPFSEKSATVLVFGHGAVIRLAAPLAPGQLVFLTNEKSKKEVVCQVVKSKSDGNAIGYVELRFTEPAPGFWGMRFPSDTVLPQAAARPTAPATPAAPPKAPAAPPAIQPVAQVPVAPAKPVAPPAPSPMPPAPQVAPSLAGVANPAPATGSMTSAPEPKNPFPTPVPPSPFVVSEATAPPAPVASAPPAPVSESKVAAPVTSKPSASNVSTEELKQQAARLQEQLSSLLFTENAKSGAPADLPSAPAVETVAVPELAQKVLDLPASVPEQTPPAPPKAAPPVAKSPVSSLEVEEIKIPSWLAPLARETETSASPAKSNSFHTEGTNSDVESVIPQTPSDLVLSEAQDSSRRPEAAIFGGQLLGDARQSGDAQPSKSRTGLFIGIAASLLLIAGGAWYSRQPGNALSALVSRNSGTAKYPAASSPIDKPPVESAPVHAASISHTPEPVHVNPPVESAPVPTPPVERVVHNLNPAPSTAVRPPQLEPEEPKKPSLGDVRLAAPVVNRDADDSNGPASAPSLELNQPATSSNPVPSLAGAHRAGPVAPTPIGGEVKPAKLIKSVAPVYPEMARSQHVSGDVQIDALIDAEGNVSSMKVLSGSPLLHQAALNALKQWKYQPAELDGKATAMHLTVTIKFRTQ